MEFFIVWGGGLVALMIVFFIILRWRAGKAQESQQRVLRYNENLAPERLQLVHRSGAWTGPRREIYRDSETGVQYLIIGSSYGGSATVMVDQDGKPLAK